jgi:hypothetical protein
MFWKVKLGENVLNWGRDDLIKYVSQYGNVIAKSLEHPDLILEGGKVSLVVITNYDCTSIVSYGFKQEGAKIKQEGRFTCLIEAVRWFQRNSEVCGCDAGSN